VQLQIGTPWAEPNMRADTVVRSVEPIRTVKEWREYRQQCNPPAVDDRPMHRGVPRDEHQVTRLNSPRLFANPETALAFQYEHEFIMGGLNVDHVGTVFEDVDVA
jgi:hypothetical protein